MRQRARRIPLDMALAQPPAFQREDKLAAFQAELDLLQPFVGKPMALRQRVDELRQRIHDLTGLAFDPTEQRTS